MIMYAAVMFWTVLFFPITVNTALRFVGDISESVLIGIETSADNNVPDVAEVGAKVFNETGRRLRVRDQTAATGSDFNKVKVHGVGDGPGAGQVREERHQMSGVGHDEAQVVVHFDPVVPAGLVRVTSTDGPVPGTNFGLNHVVQLITANVRELELGLTVGSLLALLPPAQVYFVVFAATLWASVQ